MAEVDDAHGSVAVVVAPDPVVGRESGGPRTQVNDARDTTERLAAAVEVLQELSAKER